MQRICFQLQVKLDKLDAYRTRHAAVWPEMLSELAASGRTNYSLFLREDGLLIGYFETDSLERSTAYLAASARWSSEECGAFPRPQRRPSLRGRAYAARWEADMAEFFEAEVGRADQRLDRLPEIFNLDNQLAQAGDSRK